MRPRITRITLHTMTWLTVAWLLFGIPPSQPFSAPVAAQDTPRDAVALGRTRDPALYDAFHAGYRLAPSGEVERVEVITEFRRAVLIVREHADRGEYSFNENNLAREMAPYTGLVTFVAQVRLNPLHTLLKPPPYEMYVRTGPATKPLKPASVKREPMYPPGFNPGGGPAMIGFSLETNVARAEILNAAEPALVIVNDRGAVIWQARIDFSRFR